MIEIRNLTKSFADNTILDNINISIPSNEIVALIGRNGSGKTTLLRILANLVTPDSGDILFNSRSLKKGDCALINNNERSFFWRLSAYENLIYFAGMSGMQKEKIDSKIKELSRKFKIDSKLKEKFSSLSAGEKKKIGLIRVLLRDQSIYLFDEVTSSLDSESKKILLEIILDKKFFGNSKIIFWVTHNLNELEGFCKSYLYLSNAKVSMKGIVSAQDIQQISSLMSREINV